MQHSIFSDMRRQSERYVTKANAFVHCHGQFRNAKVIDYSAGGLQLAGTFGLIKRDPIEVELISGTRISGQVAWSLGDRIGVVFSEQLPTGHPALTELSRPLRTRALDYVARGRALA